MKSFSEAYLTSNYLTQEDLSGLLSGDLSALSTDLYIHVSADLSNKIMCNDMIRGVSAPISVLTITRMNQDQYTIHGDEHNLSDELVIVEQDLLNAYGGRIISVADPRLDSDAVSLGSLKHLLSVHLDPLMKDPEANIGDLLRALQEIYSENPTPSI